MPETKKKTKTATKKKTSKASTKKTTKSASNKTLLVVESPAKAKTINKYLGRNYIVEASVGHIKDLTKFRLGVDIENGFEPNYITIRGKADVIKRLKQLAGESKNVLIATDPDREGEAIAWHIAEEVKKKNENVRRVLFNEITEEGIKQGINEPRELDNRLFMAQQARRVMDRLIGYKVSPFLSKALITKTSAALSAGRVQSVALRLISEREVEITSFVTIPYWSINADFYPENEKKKLFNARLHAIDGNSLKNPEGTAEGKDKDETAVIQEKLKEMNYIKSEKQAIELVDEINQQSYIIFDKTKKDVKRKAPAPFTTSLLQQEASRKLGFSNKKTMQIAQSLYEGKNLGDEGSVGLITYMRTDSMRISPVAQEAAKEHIHKTFGKDYIPAKPQVYKSKSASTQDAHEAIRPTGLGYTPVHISKFLNRDEARLYALIYNRFLASQMKPAILEQTSITVTGGRFEFRATGSVIKFDGYLKVYDDALSEKKTILPKGIQADVPAILEKSGFTGSETKPKPRFNEASLVKKLDELGIGRPSTYAQIVTTLLDREYVNITSKAFVPTELGLSVNEVLVNNFPELFNVEFTAGMEEELDSIAEGNIVYGDMLMDFYQPFTNSLQKAEESGNIPEIICDACGAPMEIKVSRRGRFLGCSRYPDCTNTKPLPKGEIDLKKHEDTKPEIMPGVNCDLCGSDMVIRTGKFGRFLGCVKYPECKGIKPLTTHVECPECHKGELVEKFSPKAKKKFWGCSTYPDCKYLTNHEPVNHKCEQCNNLYLEVRYKKTSDGYDKYIFCPKCKSIYTEEILEGAAKE